MSLKNSIPEGERFSYDYFFLEYVCRLCWGADGVIDLSSFSPKSTENDATIAEKIQECIGIDVTTVSHPKKVCTKCLNEIEIFCEFKRFCQETDRKLQVIFQEGTSKEKILQPKIEKEENPDEPMILEEETNKIEISIEFSNIDLDNSIDDNVFDDLPLSCAIGRNIEDRPARKKRKNRSSTSTYCNLCRLDLESIEKLTEHNLECHIDDRPARKKRKNRPSKSTCCNSCHLDLESIEKLTEHNLECHGIEENGLCNCFGCEKRFKNVKKRLRHEVEACKGLKNGYKCNICDRFLPKRGLYECHMRAHRENKVVDSSDGIYRCNKCLKSFESTECLREHMLTHYKREKKTYVCDICGRVFTRPDYLYKHKLVHEGSKLQKCPHCDYKTVQRSSLTVHIRKHTGERPYACDMCSHRCVTSSNLLAHRKRHFGVKAFECKLCDKKFGYKISLEEHMSAVHERSESHACMHCGSTYSRFRGLRRHLLGKHGKKVKKTRDNVVEFQNEAKDGMNDSGFDLKGAEGDSVELNTDGGAFYGVGIDNCTLLRTLDRLLTNVAMSAFDYRHFGADISSLAAVSVHGTNVLVLLFIL